MSEHFFGLKPGAPSTMVEFVDGPSAGVHSVGFDPYGDLWPFLGDGDESYALVNEGSRKYYKYMS